MAKITAKTQKVFAESSPDLGQFGSGAAGTMVTDSDPDIIMALPAWALGLNAATISGSKLMILEERQAIDYVMTRQIGYILQEGIPEYNGGTTYFENSIVKEAGTVKLYKSLTDDNTGNALTDAAEWVELADLDTINRLDNWVATVVPDADNDETEGYSQGSKWYDTVGGEAYLCVDPSESAAIWALTTLTADDLGDAAFTSISSIKLISQNSQSADYTAVIGDAGGHVLHPSADTTARTWTIPANASVAYPIGTALTFVNQDSAGAITLAITSDTMRFAGDGTTGDRTLAANGIATALKITATEWIISGVGLS